MRFEDGDSPVLKRTPAVAGNREVWSWSGWIKKASLTSSYHVLFGQGDTGTSSQTSIWYYQDNIGLYWGGPGGPQHKISAKHRDPAAWMHICVGVDTNALPADDMCNCLLYTSPSPRD